MHQGAADADALWLETLQLVAARAAHELKGALNGVSVNLEVVRGRAANPAQPASALSRFAESAASQLDVVIDMNDALLALVRRPREPVDVGSALRHVAALLVPVAQAAGMPVTIRIDADGLTVASAAPPAAVRSLLARGVMAIIDAGGGTVQLSEADGVTVVRMAVAGAGQVGGTAAGGVAAGTSDGRLTLDARAQAVAAGAGITLRSDGSLLTLTFPVAAPTPAPAGTPTHGTA